MDQITASLAARRDAFIAAADAAHGGRYDYSLVIEEYRNVKQRVTIICPEHGRFRQAPQDHTPKTVKGKFIPGQACPDCSLRRGSRSSVRRDQFLAHREVHGGRYDYTAVVYVDQHAPVTLSCASHGVFEVRPTNHLARANCPDCAATQRAGINAGWFGGPRRPYRVKRAAKWRATEARAA